MMYVRLAKRPKPEVSKFDILKQAAFVAPLLFAASFLAAQNSGTGDLRAGDSGAPRPAGLSVTALVEAAEGLSLDWRPDWPLSAPPDLFYTLPESGAAGITVTFEPPENGFAEQEPAAGESVAGETVAGEIAGVEISAEWQNGRLVRFPVFRDSSFIQAKAEYDASGTLTGITGEDLEMAILAYDEGGRPVTVRIKTEGAYFFAAVEYVPDRITETWYDENGSPRNVLYAGKTGDSVSITYGENGAEAETTKFFFNSYGSVSEIRSPEGSWSARYERRGFPRYLERNLGNGPERYSFQWDEAGRLTRLSGLTEDGRSADSRFEYDLDDRGNWIVRRELTMTNISGRLFPGPGAVVKRRIQYGDRP
jgi:hypothetical protein